jgi:lipoprotein-releasing system permease protein
MSIVTLLSKRFLTGKKRNGFLSFIAAVSLFGVCLGVAALTVVMSVMEGFESELRSIVTGTHSHIMLYSQRQVIPNRYELEERVKKIAGKEIEALSAYVFSEVVLAKGARVSGSMVEGIEPSTIANTTRIQKHLVLGIMPEPAKEGSEPTIMLGAALSESLGAKIGDSISVISPFFEKESLQPRARRFKVSGILQTGMYEYDSKYSIVHAQEARDFFRLPDGSATAFKIKTASPDKSHLLATRMQKELGYPYRVRDWTELNRNLLYAIRLQKAVIFIILTAIIVVAAFNIMSTLMMMMSEKKKEMSILKAMGLSPRQSSGVFISVGLIIGISGAIAGIALGLTLGLILSKTRFIELPPDIYFISYLPVDVRLPTLLLIAACAVLVALLATLYPGWRVAKESPVEGLRYE